ncbi:glycoside hydrolase superfamily [Mycena galopus ATCC 62051]|nr:glycoside hydrolase superfamily [Mycena galopus ATCC 62051]
MIVKLVSRIWWLCMPLPLIALITAASGILRNDSVKQVPFLMQSPTPNGQILFDFPDLASFRIRLGISAGKDMTPFTSVRTFPQHWARDDIHSFILDDITRLALEYAKGLQLITSKASEPVWLIISGPDNPLDQPSTFVDQLADSAGCARDLPFLQQLGVNAIRAYSVDLTLNHDSCMAALSGAGIHVILDPTLPLNGSIDTTQPTWSTNLQDEVLTSSATNAAPFIKAAARDIKAYLASISSSALVGYADIDGTSNFRDAVANYLQCDPSGTGSGATSIDLFGLNNYEWCGNASTTTYDALNAEFANYNVAAYLGRTGFARGVCRMVLHAGAYLRRRPPFSASWSCDGGRVERQTGDEERDAIGPATRHGVAGISLRAREN